MAEQTTCYDLLYLKSFYEFSDNTCFSLYEYSLKFVSELYDFNVMLYISVQRRYQQSGHSAHPKNNKRSPRFLGLGQYEYCKVASSNHGYVPLKYRCFDFSISIG